MPEPRASLALMVVLALACAGCAITAGPGASADPPEVSRAPMPTDPAATDAETPAAEPSPSIEPTPSPEPDPRQLDLRTTSCEGGVVLEWSPSRQPGFHHYIALRSPEREIATAYPPIAPAVDWGDTFATDPFVTSAVDASIVPSERTWHYRVMAYDEAGRVIGASAVRAARLSPVVQLGMPAATPLEGGRTRINWPTYGGFSRCFSAYRVLYGSPGQALGVLTTVSRQAQSSIDTTAFHAGVTYVVRVQAVRSTTLGSFVVAETDLLTYTAP
jgi:hypothetical protein